jgi:hypothetical protein
MTVHWTVLLAASLLNVNTIAAYAQPVQSGPEAAPISLENNTILYLELAKTVDVKKVKPGDPVSAKLLADVVSQGRVVLHHDMKVMGHITEAQPLSKENHESRLGFVIDKFMLKNGHELAFSSDLLAIGAAPRIEMSAAPSGPTPPGMNPASTQQQERHYPVPKGGPSIKTISPPTGDSPLKGDMEQHAKSMQDFVPTDIEGISLAHSSNGTGRVVVSMQHTVKLENGVRLELRVTDPNQMSKDQVHAP